MPKRKLGDLDIEEGESQGAETNPLLPPNQRPRSAGDEEELESGPRTPTESCDSGDLSDNKDLNSDVVNGDSEKRFKQGCSESLPDLLNPESTADDVHSLTPEYSNSLTPEDANSVTSELSQEDEDGELPPSESPESPEPPPEYMTDHQAEGGATCSHTDSHNDTAVPSTSQDTGKYSF